MTAGMDSQTVGLGRYFSQSLTAIVVGAAAVYRFNELRRLTRPITQ